MLCVAAATLVGCSGSGSPAALNPDDFVQKKIDAMTKMAEVTEQGNPENRIVDALEAYRAVPFNIKGQPDAAKTILAIYETRIKGKIRGDAAADLAGEIAILEREMKSQ